MSVLDNLEYVNLIGEGYFSIVKEYRNNDNGNRIAVKELKEKFNGEGDYKKRFSREIDLLNDLKGVPHVIELIDWELTKDHSIYLMPRADSNLYKYIKTNNSSLSIDKRFDIFEQVLSAVKSAHAKQILHRDISPTNALIFDHKNNPRIELADFGLGKNRNEINSLTRSSVKSYGQIYYVAPEQKERLRSATVRSDIYSLGKLLNFILTGRDPDIIHQCDMTTICRCACSENPDDRYADVIALESDYLTLKDLLIGPPKPQDDWTIRERLQSGADISWQEFHHFILQGKSYDHIYDDHLEPLITFLSKNDNLARYIAAIGVAVDEFTETLIDQLHNCYGTVGWPFSSMNWFGRFLYDIYNLTPSLKAKLLCLEEIWSLAYEGDQWSVQSIMVEIITNNKIPEELIADFAMRITKSEIHSNKPKIRSGIVPPAIRNAIDSLQWRE